MASSLYSGINAQQAQQQPSPQGQNGGGNIVQQFMNFANNFKGNPEQTVRGLVQNGKMTQGQFNQLSQMADQIMGIRRQ